MEFKRGDRIRMKDDDRWVTGEITIIKENESKVLWDGDFDLNYWYYPNKELELIFRKEEGRE